MMTERDIVARAARRQNARDRQMLLLGLTFLTLAGAILWRWVGAP
jgi:hypothetical protein